jgi:hypothetical protein
MSSHDYHIAAEADVSGKVNRHIWFYFIVLGILLGATLIGLTIMYRFASDYEKTEKIGMVNTEESIAQTNLSQSYISGKRGLFEGKKNVPVEEAMKRFVSAARGLE